MPRVRTRDRLPGSGIGAIGVGAWIVWDTVAGDATFWWDGMAGLVGIAGGIAVLVALWKTRDW
jgi:hypothetical protein